MIYLSAEYILSAIQQLEAVHTFIGITFLTCKKHELPVGIPTEFLMDSNTKHFMTSVHKICPSSDFYFQPYQTIRGKQWLAAKYHLQVFKQLTRKHSVLRLSMIEKASCGHGQMIMSSRLKE